MRSSRIVAAAMVLAVAIGCASSTSPKPEYDQRLDAREKETAEQKEKAEREYDEKLAAQRAARDPQEAALAALVVTINPMSVAPCRSLGVLTGQSDASAEDALKQEAVKLGTTTLLLGAASHSKDDDVVWTPKAGFFGAKKGKDHFSQIGETYRCEQPVPTPLPTAVPTPMAAKEPQ